MKSGFKDPAAIKGQKPQDKPKDGKNSPWDFRCPQYDQRSDGCVRAGTNYGVGYRNPVGHAGDAKDSDVIPKGRVKTMELYED